jgi:hypothetical protein
MLCHSCAAGPALVLAALLLVLLLRSGLLLESHLARVQSAVGQAAWPRSQRPSWQPLRHDVHASSEPLSSGSVPLQCAPSPPARHGAQLAQLPRALLRLILGIVAVNHFEEILDTDLI